MQPKMVEQDGKGVKEIPIPGVTTIASYQYEYLPTWKARYTYIRGRGEILGRASASVCMLSTAASAAVG
jgi:hypothetical protein